MILEVTDLSSNQATQVELDENQLSEKVLNKLQKNEVFLAPGLVDLQINGYKGIDFNSGSLTIEQIENAVKELLKDGVTAFLPTLITNDPRIIERNLGLFRQACEENVLLGDCIWGIHLEGPFISREDGARGAHPVEWIIEPSLELLDKWQKISGDRIKLITLSPEYKKSLEFIKKCIKEDIKVSIGHTKASSEQIQASIKAGASMSTHLGNAISQTLHRHKNILFDQISNDHIFASIITDGHHLPNELIKIICRTKPGKVFLVSDSTMFSGMKPGIYDSIIGKKIELSENKRLSIYEDEEYLAGSASSLADCLNYLLKESILSLEHAWEMASSIPGNFIAPGRLPSNNGLVLISVLKDEIEILASIKNDRVFAH